MSKETITPSSATDNSFDPDLIYIYNKGKIKLKKTCFKQETVSFIHENVINLYISYELDKWPKDLNLNLTLDNCLFWAVKLTKNGDPDKYIYSGYDIGFDTRSHFSWTWDSWGKNIVVFGDHMSSSVHVNDKKIIS